MARVFQNLNFENENKVKSSLKALADKNTNVDDYRHAFYLLGVCLGELLKKEGKVSENNCHLVCASEDADWLAQGVLEGASIMGADLSVYWSSRHVISTTPKIEITPITREYNSKLEPRDFLIVVKSIISTSCVVKTQISHIFDNISPKHVYVIAPVMFKDAENSLKNEFPQNISDLFKFYTFAIDSDSDENGVISPGVGGMVYPRLGVDKNTYIPSIIRMRMG